MHAQEEVQVLKRPESITSLDISLIFSTNYFNKNKTKPLGKDVNLISRDIMLLDLTV